MTFLSTIYLLVHRQHRDREGPRPAGGRDVRGGRQDTREVQVETLQTVHSNSEASSCLSGPDFIALIEGVCFL